MSDYRWTLVTVTYNSGEKLRRYWRDISFPETVEWIVADNASSDDTVKVAEGLGARVISLHENLGFAAANNVAYAASESSFVAFVNPDVTPDLSTLPGLEKAIEETSGLVAPQLRNDDGSLQPNGRGWPFLSDKVLHRLRPASVAQRYRLFARPGQSRKVIWLTGAVVASSRQVFDRLCVQQGPWDEKYFLYYEDSDLGLRARRQGISSWVLGDQLWSHGWARETSGFNFMPWKREIGSMVKFYLRYPSLVVRVPWTKRSV